MSRKTIKAKTGKMGAVDRFIALPDEEKERIYQEIDSKTPEQLRAESRPLTPAERRQLAKFRRGLGPGRPKIKEGSKPVNITIERALLRRADEYASSHGISRAQLVARGLELALAD